MSKLKALLTQISALYKVPGNKAPIIRLVLVAITIVGGILLSLLALPPITDGFVKFLGALFTALFAPIIYAAIVWGFAKWVTFFVPKTLAIARGFWDSLVAWGLIGLIVKIMVWIWLAFLPVPLFGLILSPLSLLIYGLAKLGIDWLTAPLLILVFAAVLAFMILLDVCHLTGQEWKPVLRSGFARVRSACTKKEA